MNKNFFAVCVAVLFSILFLTGCTHLGGGNSGGNTREVSNSHTLYEMNTRTTETDLGNAYMRNRFGIGGSKIPAKPVRDSESSSSNGVNGWDDRRSGSDVYWYTVTDNNGNMKMYSTTYDHRSESSGRSEPPVYYNTFGGNVDGNPGIQPGYVEGSFGLGRPGKK